jgi:hypothetical protein
VGVELGLGLELELEKILPHLHRHNCKEKKELIIKFFSYRIF